MGAVGAAYRGWVSAPTLQTVPTVRPTTLAVTVAALADTASVVLFAAVGRSSHAEGLDLAGVASTSWPFLAGAAAGWAVSRAWRRPATVRTGAVVWAGAVVIGMALRVAVGQGTALSFTIVTAVVLGAFLLGWRAVGAAVRRRRAR